MLKKKGCICFSRQNGSVWIFESDQDITHNYYEYFTGVDLFLHIYEDGEERVFKRDTCFYVFCNNRYVVFDHLTDAKDCLAQYPTVPGLSILPNEIRSLNFFPKGSGKNVKSV